MSATEQASLVTGDLVQITDEAHPWFPAVLVVSEVRTWGVQACVIVPQSNVQPPSCAQMWNRLRTGAFVRVGAAAVVPG